MTFDKTSEALSDTAVSAARAHITNLLSIQQTGLAHDEAQSFAAKQRTLILLFRWILTQLYTDVGINAPDKLQELDEVLLAGWHCSRSEADVSIILDAKKKASRN